MQHRLRGHLKPVVNIDIHPKDQKKMLSCSLDGIVKFWE